jgi:uncharacterized delta-60 repeat protein
MVTLFMLLGGLTVHGQLDGFLDPNFTPSVSGSIVYCTAVQPDGKILIGGIFGNVGSLAYTNIARLNAADGSVDTNFNYSYCDNAVSSIAVQADGKILIGGLFTSVNGTPYNRLARLNADGTLDTTFNDPAANGQVNCIALQPDGKILIGGWFDTVGGTPYHYVARLNPDGTVDPSFNDPNASSWVYSLAIQLDGHIVIGGVFTITNMIQTNRYIARLNTDGTLDTNFTNPNANGQVSCLALQADGKILVGGSFTTVSNVNHKYIARLNSGGTVDNTFLNTFVSTLGASSSVYSIALQADGRILFAGGNSGSTIPLYRLNANGTKDTNFSQTTSGACSSISLQGNPTDPNVQPGDGFILIAGGFSGVAATTQPNLARLVNWTPPSQTLSVPNSTQVKWLRSGPTAEVNFTTFELSTDGGVTWTALGDGTRITGGWQLTGLSLPSSGLVRARGLTIGGQYDGSSGLIEQIASYSVASAPVVLSYSFNGGKLVLSWPNGVLQAATAVNGPYTNVPNAISPYTNSSLTSPPRSFYRVQVQ